MLSKIIDYSSGLLHGLEVKTRDEQWQGDESESQQDGDGDELTTDNEGDSGDSDGHGGGAISDKEDLMGDGGDGLDSNADNKNKVDTAEASGTLLRLIRCFEVCMSMLMKDISMFISFVRRQILQRI